MSRVILASASPRRRELLTQIGLKFDIMASTKEEIIRSPKPEEVVMELAEMKAEDIRKQLSVEKDTLIIGADTVVAMDGEILGKPADEAAAFHMLMSLQGKTHRDYTWV